MATTLNNDFVLFSTGQTIGASSSATMKNRLINGGMVIDQRNNGGSVTPISGQYLVDRFAYASSQSGNFTVQQNAGGITPPTGFTNYLGLTVASAYTITSTDYFSIVQNIEGYNIADLAWGTSNAKTVTLSFWVYSSLTGTFNIAIRGASFSRTYVSSYTIPTANTWTKIFITIPGDTSGTYIVNNGIGFQVWFNLGSGSSISTSTTNTWLSGNFTGATGATSVVGTSGATFYITGVQLEVGTVASSFDYRDYGGELIMCQRYYQTNFLHTLAAGTTSGDATLVFPVQMRTTPSTSYTDTTGALGKYTDSGGSGQTFAVDASGGTTGAWKLQTALARSAAWVQLNYFFNAEL